MASRRRTRSTSRRGRTRSRYIWTSDYVDPFAGAQNVQSTTELLTNIELGVKTGATIVRIIGQWATRAGASDQDLQAAFGLIMVDEDARLAGALPDLATAPDDARWMWQDSQYLFDGDIAANQDQWRQRPVDYRGRRRIGSRRDRLLVVAENFSAVAQTINFIWNLRTLLRLP